MKRLLLSLIAVVSLVAVPPAHSKDDKWVEARSPNFIVVTNAGAQQARATAIQFEQIRALFQQSFTFAKGRPTPVITILAAKNESTLKELLPEYWAEKGHMHPAGIFLSFPYQQSVAVQLSGLGDNPYEAIYHEYYHSLTIPYFPRLPLWFSEGMADFYGNSKIVGKDASMGMPDYGLIQLLRQQSLIPLGNLFRVDHSSPYYNESNKVSVFYAESWALTHYFMMADNGTRRQELSAYLAALGQGASQEEAAAKAFGDLGKLQKALQSYIGSGSFFEFRSPAPEKIPENSVQVRSLSEAEADAYRGGFLSLHRQYKEADALLSEAVRLDPKLALAQQNRGLSDYMQGKFADAITAFSGAIEDDPNVMLTRYLRAQLVSGQGVSEQSDSQVEGDLHAAIAANANFAPAYGLLANHLASRGENLTEALECAKKSVALEPGNSYYQLVLAQVLARMKHYDQAQAVALVAQGNALNPQDKANADQFIEFVQRAKDIEARNNQIQSHAEAALSSMDAAGDQAQAAVQPEEEEQQADDGKLRVEGTITDIQCKAQAMEITVLSQDGPVTLHSSDYAKIDFLSDIPLKSEEFWPCTTLKGRTAKATYLPNTTTGKPYAGEVGTLEIKK